MRKFPFAIFLSSLWLALAPLGNGQGGGTWETLAPMPVKRQELAAAALNGKIYVLGGLDGQGLPTATVEVYDPLKGTWSFAQSLPFVTDHNRAAVAAGRLYTLDGWVYDEAQDAWTTVAAPRFLAPGSYTTIVRGAGDSTGVALVEAYALP
ncbi:MAG: hypothetical protein H0V54_00420 [Chthoniobacterales bacterium]|nr:hypothetical protein [Chthoniobacterales bacterium]